MNPQLARLLARHFPTLDLQAASEDGFLAAVSKGYDEFQQEQRFLEHTLEVTSAELTEANEKLRRDSEDRLQSLNRYYRRTLELQQGMILCFRKTERGFEHTLCRGQLALRLGWTPEKVEGRTLPEFFSPAQADALSGAYERAWAGEDCSAEAQSADGSADFLALLRPLREDGVVREVIVSCVEITALKRLERELRGAKERAESADRAKGEFLAVMSHEMRTPLNAIIGFCRLLRESPLAPERDSWLATLESSGESLHALIGDILDYSKIEAGKLVLDEQAVEIAELLDSVAEMFRASAAEKGIEIEVAPVGQLPAVVVTDGTRLRQILVNLVGNAVKFTSRGRVCLAATLADDVAGSDCVLRFEVSDTGIGIRPEHRVRLFKPFSQADSSTTRAFGGTGLGLAICDRLVRALGGDIDFTSEFGRGTKFTFTIRAAFEVPAGPGSDSQSEPPLPPGLRILVAEDNPVNRSLMKQIFRHLGYSADFAEDGLKAAAAARTKDYDLIVMDLLMPELDGFDATRQILADSRESHTPRIVALTACTLGDEHKRCLEVGMSAVLTKPVRVDLLRAEMSRARPLQTA